MANYYGQSNEPGMHGEHRREWHGGRSEEGRGFFDRAGDEVRSWFGNEEAEQRRRMDEYEMERLARQGSYWRSGYSPNDLLAGDLMSRQLLTVHAQDRVAHAARLMRDWDCGALPVIDWGGHLLGIVTDRDITVRLVADEVDARNVAVADCMTREVIACHTDDSLRECLHQMARQQLRRLPVINEQNQVIGIISQSDLARHAGVYTGHGERRMLANVLCAVSEPSHHLTHH